MLRIWGRRSSFNVQKVMWLIGELPHVERWYRTLQQREAFRRHVMIPFGELRGRLDYQA